MLAEKEFGMKPLGEGQNRKLSMPEYSGHHILIVVSDGVPDNASFVLDEAMLLKNSNVFIFTILVDKTEEGKSYGYEVSEERLLEIASPGGYFHVSVDGLARFLEDLSVCL